MDELLFSLPNEDEAIVPGNVVFPGDRCSGCLRTLRNGNPQNGLLEKSSEVVGNLILRNFAFLNFFFFFYGEEIRTGIHNCTIATTSL